MTRGSVVLALLALAQAVAPAAVGADAAGRYVEAGTTTEVIRGNSDDLRSMHDGSVALLREVHGAGRHIEQRDAVSRGPVPAMRGGNSSGAGPRDPRPRRCDRSPWLRRCRELAERPPLPQRPPVAVCGVRCVVEAVVREEGFGSLWDAGWVEAVVNCESRWVVNAVSPYGHLGLWQIDPRWFNGTWASLAGPWDDAEANTRAATHILRIQGRNAWSCSPW